MTPVKRSSNTRWIASHRSYAGADSRYTYVTPWKHFYATLSDQSDLGWDGLCLGCAGPGPVLQTAAAVSDLRTTAV